MIASKTKLAQFVQVNDQNLLDKRVCQWAKNCYENAKTVTLRVESRRAAEKYNTLLWTFDDMSFIPHSIAGSPSPNIVDPVIICPAENDMFRHEILVEATGGNICADFKLFKHIIDFALLYDDDLKQKSRKRYKAYQSAGYTMKMIKS